MIAKTRPDFRSIREEPLDILPTFCERVRYYMALQNLSHRELCERVNAIRGRNSHMSAIQEKYEGKHVPSLEWIQIFSRALGVDRHDLI